MNNKLLIVLKAFMNGAKIDHEDRILAMDENFDVGFVFTKNEEEVIVGDRLTVGQLAKIAESLSEEQIAVLAAQNTLSSINEQRLRERDSKRNGRD